MDKIISYWVLPGLRVKEEDRLPEHLVYSKLSTQAERVEFILKYIEERSGEEWSRKGSRSRRVEHQRWLVTARASLYLFLHLSHDEISNLVRSAPKRLKDRQETGLGFKGNHTTVIHSVNYARNYWCTNDFDDITYAKEARHRDCFVKLGIITGNTDLSIFHSTKFENKKSWKSLRRYSKSLQETSLS